MKLLLAAACIIVASTFAVADWQVTKKIDTMTDELKVSAYVVNEDGHKLTIYRISEGGAVWGNFSLSTEAFDQISPQIPPIYRVDKNEPKDLAQMKKMNEMSAKYGLGIQGYEWQPKWINFLIWHGKEDEGISDQLVNLMEGERVVFRYYLGTGGYKETSFDLKGAASAISEAVGINNEIDHSKQEEISKFKNAVSMQIDLCKKKMTRFKKCSSRVLECSEQAGGDLQTFKLCLSK